MRRCRGGDGWRAALALAPIVARLLCHARPRRSRDARARFLNPSLDHLHDPFALADMRARRRAHPEAPSPRKERIAIHGDYDVDGITSTVILRRALELLGGDVVHFIPERLRTATACSRRRSSGCTPKACALVISVDCGIRGAEAARRARELGVDLIITDHHEPDADAAAGARGHQPEAPRLHVSRQEPRRRRRRAEAGAGAVPRAPAASSWLPGFVKIAAIGTLADVVPLVGENRVIAKLGLDLLSQGPAQGRPARAARRRRA